MKKVLSLILVCLLLVITCTVAFADSTNKEEKVKLYKYNYDEIKVTSNVELTDEQLEDLINTIKNRPTENFIPNPDDNSTVVAGPSRRNYTNTGVQITANAIIAWTAANTPAFSTTAFGAFVYSTLATWCNNNIVPTYVESWVSKSYSSYDDMYKYYSTTVHYSDSTYRTVLEVQYYNTVNAYY